MLRDFLASGMLVVEDRSKFGIRTVIEGLLKPMGLVRKRGNQFELLVNPKQNELARQLFDHMGQAPSVPFEDMYRHFRKGEYGLLQPHFEILVMALVFSGHLLAFRGTQRMRSAELSRHGLRGVSALARGEIVSERLRDAITAHPLIPGRFKDTPLTLASQEELWSELTGAKAAAVEELEALRSRVRWASSFEAFSRLPWDRVLTAVERLKTVWDEVKVSFTSKEGLERFMGAGTDPALEDDLGTVRDAGAFMEKAERALFVYQYLTDPRLHLPPDPQHEGLTEMRAGILGCFEGPDASISESALDKAIGMFQEFRQDYSRRYTEAHGRARAGGRFEPYENLNGSRRYGLLARLDRLEMISVEHDRASVDRGISSVLLQRCLRRPQDHLQTQPVCACGFKPGDRPSFTPVKDLETAIDAGIRETLDALHSPGIQEKLVPYLEGLSLVGKEKEADEIGRLLRVSPDDDALCETIDRALTPAVVRHVNEAFRGKVGGGKEGSRRALP